MTRAPNTDPRRLLERCPVRRMRRRLVRCVPHLDFSEHDPPSFLYTSGRPGRCNPRGVSCLYFSETESAADAEYRRHWQGTVAEHQPRLVYSARVTLRRIIDLGNSETVELLGLSDDDFDANWRLAPVPTTLQLIGQSIASQHRISALRFPSAAARRLGAPGWNVAIYPAALRRPDKVEILGKTTRPLEVIP